MRRASMQIDARQQCVRGASFGEIHQESLCLGCHCLGWCMHEVMVTVNASYKDMTSMAVIGSLRFAVRNTTNRIDTIAIIGAVRS